MCALPRVAARASRTLCGEAIAGTVAERRRHFGFAEVLEAWRAVASPRNVHVFVVEADSNRILVCSYWLGLWLDGPRLGDLGWEFMLYPPCCSSVFFVFASRAANEWVSAGRIFCIVGSADESIFRDFLPPVASPVSLSMTHFEWLFLVS